MYKSFADLTQNEVASIKQCYTVLSKYTVFLAAPEGFDLAGYHQLAVGETRVQESRFEKKYFQSIEGYSKLLLNPSFYKTYLAFDYMLIYQLDAWVFKDELEYWCNKGYSYMGAPWFDDWGMETIDGKHTIIGVGNGGFSLRKVSTHLRVLNSFSYVDRPKDIWRKFTRNKEGIRKKALLLLSLLLNLSFKNNTFFLLNHHQGNEDGFWGFFASRNFEWFTVAEYSDALRFCIELHPSYCYGLIGKQLPFGCHAWEKYEPTFWQAFIQTQGVC